MNEPYVDISTGTSISGKTCKNHRNNLGKVAEKYYLCLGKVAEILLRLMSVG